MTLKALNYRIFQRVATPKTSMFYMTQIGARKWVKYSIDSKRHFSFAGLAPPPVSCIDFFFELGVVGTL